MIDSASLSEEAVELPELALLPIVKRMIVALCALNLDTHEQSSCLGRCLNLLVPHCHLSQQEIDRTVFFEMAFGEMMS